MGECISQLRWISFQNIPRPLSHVQIYDSASRGPWGAIQIMFHDKFRSLVTIGASITLLALAFEPFVQQIIAYHIKEVEHPSNATKIKQSRFFIPNYESLDYVSAFQNAFWTSDFGYDLPCPSGNCRWPTFQSVELCNKCEDVTNSAQLHGCDTSSINLQVDVEYTQFKASYSPCNVSLPDGPWSQTPVEVDIVGRSNGLKQVYFGYPQDVWLLDHQDLLSGPGGKYRLSNKTYLGVQNPIVVYGHSQITLESNWANATFQHPVLTPRIEKATECLLSLCLKTYNVSVNDGISSVTQSEPNFGSFWVQREKDLPTTFGLDPTTICWKPNSEPLTDLTTIVYRNDTVEVMNSAQHEFCDYDVSGQWWSMYLHQNLDMSGYTQARWTFENNSQPLSRANSGVSNAPLPSKELRKIVESGLEQVMKNLAASLSKYARNLSNATISGTSSSPEYYVVVNWAWLTLPGVLILLGIILLVSTALTNTHQKMGLWKSSVLPFLYHGLEDSLIERDQIESLSRMGQAADEVKVRLAYSDMEGRSILRWDPKISNPI